MCLLDCIEDDQMSLSTFLSSVSRTVNRILLNRQPWFIQPPPQAALGLDYGWDVTSPAREESSHEETSNTATILPFPNSDIIDYLSIWFAVPKKRVSRGKKRMKTTRQKRIKVKENIIVDRRTGEWTLMHHLPHKWKDYLSTDLERRFPRTGALLPPEEQEGEQGSTKEQHN